MSDFIQRRLDKWKRALIDVSRRNRLLNYRAHSASTVEVIDADPSDVCDAVLSGKAHTFLPKAAPSTETELSLLDPVDAPTEGSGRPANALQTSLSEDRLPTVLLNIHRRGAESLEEQGINTVFMALGMLRWTDEGGSNKTSRAPLLLLPVELTRKNVSGDFQMRAGDDDAVLNPALVEKLSLDFRITLPELPDAVDELELSSFFEEVEQAVEHRSGWHVQPDIVLGLFSFQKFIMYRDLEQNESHFLDHELIGRLCSASDDHPVSGLPHDVDTAPLDEDMAPWNTVQILDADSSQQRAMLAVRRDHHLVIEGPPGTGKSQTIANVIADALYEGKRVLFVSEKMAALEVVQDRLEAAGLDAFLLELHSNKANKKGFVSALADSLDFTRPPTEPADAELKRLEKLTSYLNDYVVQLHQPMQPLGYSPFQAIGELAVLESAPSMRVAIPDVDRTSIDELRTAQESIDRLAHTLEEIGDPSVHPLRGVGLTSPTLTDAERLEETLKAARDQLTRTLGTINTVTNELGLHRPTTIGDAELLLEAARTVAASPGSDPSVLGNPAWNAMSAEAQALLALGQSYADRRTRVQAHFKHDILEQDTSADSEAFEALLERGGWRFFFPSYWKLRRQLRDFLRPNHTIKDPQALLTEVREAQTCREERARLEASQELGSDLFGTRWRGPASDWQDLATFAEWVTGFRQYVLQEMLDARGMELAARGAPNAEQTGEIIEAATSALEGLRHALSVSMEAGNLAPESGVLYQPDTDFDALGTRLEDLRRHCNRGDLRSFGHYLAALHAAERNPLTAEFVSAATREGLAAPEWSEAFRRRFLELWLDEHALRSRPILRSFQKSQHEQTLEEFRTLDRRSVESARIRTLNALANARRAVMEGGLSDQLQTVQREARKQRRIMPIRKLMARAGDVIQLIKPCFMMSPLSVAQFLDPDQIEFDLLVFDEASQIPPADAVGAIVRSKQTVVVGDRKQLPPTTFFGARLDDSTDDEEMDLDDLESVLDEVATSGVATTRLKWHYRSEHQSLIRFSNEEFYSDDPLYVFPAAVEEDEAFGLTFAFVEDGRYEGGGRNTVEARRVADAVVEHIKERPGLSLGVGTFGIAQQNVIMDELDTRRRADPSLDWFFQQTGEQKFFVKNLENIQGDNRDVIFLSVTYGPGADGRVHRNFGPINKEGGWRRLNVLTTRAKRHLRIFSSMRGHDIAQDGSSNGARLMRRYLEFAETGVYPTVEGSNGEPDSPFEEAVIAALRTRGWTVQPQVGDSGYRVDIGVVDPDHPGRYICGIECDGASYHSTATARDRDRLRQQVLEERGWYIHRVWSTDWFYDPQGEIDRLVSLIRESRATGPREPRGHAEAPAVSRENGASPAPKVKEPPVTDPGPTTSIEDIPVPTYTAFAAEPRHPSEAFYEVPLNRIASVAEQVIATEGPMHFEEVARRVAAVWSMQRARKKIRARVAEACDLLTTRGKVTSDSDGEFVWSVNLDPIPVRSRATDGVASKSELVAPIEIEAAIRLLLQHRAPVLPDNLVKETARLLGFGRTSSLFQERILAARDRLVEAGVIRAGGMGLHLEEEEG